MKKTGKIASIVVGGLLLITLTGTALAAGTDASGSNCRMSGQTRFGGFTGSREGGTRGVTGMRSKAFGGLSGAVLTKLVEEGIISQDTADDITAYLTEKQEEQKAAMEELKGMTQEERKAYFESKKDESKDEKQSLLPQLVGEGILTRDESDAIEAWLKENRSEKSDARAGGKMSMGLRGLSEETLTKLVEEDLISQDTADDITAYLTEKLEEQKAAIEEFKGMTEEERKAYFESKKDESKDEKQSLLPQLVSEGILTQDESDVIEAYFKNPADE